MVKGDVTNETGDTQGRNVVNVEVGMEVTINSVLVSIEHLQKCSTSNRKSKPEAQEMTAFKLQNMDLALRC